MNNWYSKLKISAIYNSTKNRDNKTLRYKPLGINPVSLQGLPLK